MIQEVGSNSSGRAGRLIIVYTSEALPNGVITPQAAMMMMMLSIVRLVAKGDAVLISKDQILLKTH